MYIEASERCWWMVRSLWICRSGLAAICKTFPRGNTIWRNYNCWTDNYKWKYKCPVVYDTSAQHAVLHAGCFVLIDEKYMASVDDAWFYIATNKSISRKPDSCCTHLKSNLFKNVFSRIQYPFSSHVACKYDVGEVNTIISRELYSTDICICHSKYRRYYLENRTQSYKISNIPTNHEASITIESFLLLLLFGKHGASSSIVIGHVSSGMCSLWFLICQS